MKIAVVNSGNHGSVGSIILGVKRVALERGYETYIFCPPGKMQTKGVPNNHFIGTVVERRLSDKLNFFIGTQGRFNIIGTYRLVKKLEVLSPDIIHIHNLHTNYINLNIFFEYLKKYKGRVVWTFHDCWPFTGHCPHFEVEGCMKWKDECCECPLYKYYPENLIDRSNYLFKTKKTLFTKIENLTIVTPSEWLMNYVKQSFFNSVVIRHIANGVNLSVFKPTKSDFKKKCSIGDKFVVLSVAFSWGYKKGLDRIEKLAEELDDRFQIIIVGIDPAIVKSKKIICIPRTTNQKELAEIYTASDVLLNPTREDTFPTVNLESLACGTPVLSYGAGGSAEALDETCGAVVDDDNVIAVIHNLYDHNYDSDNCIRRAESYRDSVKFGEYVDLYENLLN